MNTWLVRLLCVAILVLLQACERPASSPSGLQADDQRVGQLFLHGLDIGGLTQISISQYGAEPLVSLKFDDGHWELTPGAVDTLLTVPANMSLIETLLLSLGNTRVLEQKTAEKSWYKHLGVNNVTSDGARGTMLVLASGDKSWQFIVGDKSSTQQGQYWRELNGLYPAVARVDQVLELPRETIDWMDREIINLPDNGVASIKINTAVGHSFFLQRDSHKQSLGVADAPADSAELPNSIKQLVFGLSRLNFDAIEAATVNVREVDQEKPAFTIEFGLFDGTSFILSLYPDATGSWCKLIAVDSGQGESAELVVEINRHLSRWRYHLSSQRAAMYTQAIGYLSGEVSE